MTCPPIDDAQAGSYGLTSVWVGHAAAQAVEVGWPDESRGRYECTRRIYRGFLWWAGLFDFHEA